MEQSYKLGDNLILSQKYGDINLDDDLSIINSITGQYVPINKKATFQEKKKTNIISTPMVKITLPTEPITLKKSTKRITPSTSPTINVNTDKRIGTRELLNFVDVDKLTKNKY